MSRFSLAVFCLKHYKQTSGQKLREDARLELERAADVLDRLDRLNIEKTISDLDGYFQFLALHGFKEPNSEMVELMSILHLTKNTKDRLKELLGY